MKETEFGCLWITSRTYPVCFCSKCQHLYTEKKSALVTKVHPIKAGDSALPIAISPLSSSHNALLYIVCEGTISDAPIVMRLTLCSGKYSEHLTIEAPYVMFHFWTLFRQVFLEFTITEDMLPDQPVPYSEGELSNSLLEQYRAMPINQIIMQGIQVAGFGDLNSLIAHTL